MIFNVEDGDAKKRLDVIVSEAAKISRSAAQKLIEGGEVLVFGKPENKKYTAKEGDVIEISIPEPEELSVEAENSPLNVIYEDEDIIVINKKKKLQKF